jgi:hypothetical protein
VFSFHSPTILAMAGPGSIAEPSDHERAICLRKYRHANYLTALHHARLIDDGGLAIYGCQYCEGAHVGHSQNPSLSTRLRRNAAKLDKAHRALRTNDGSMKLERRRSLEQSIVDLRRQRRRLEAELRAAQMDNPTLVPPPEPRALVSRLLIDIGVRLQHLGCEIAYRAGARPREANA